MATYNEEVQSEMEATEECCGQCQENNDEVNSEFIDDSTVGETEVCEKEEKIAELEKEVAMLKDKFLRNHAEVENFKRRMTQEKETLAKYSLQKIFTELLPVLDNLDRAMGIENPQENFDSFFQGIEMIQNSFMETLTKEGLEVIESSGCEFDPNFHLAVMQDSDPSIENNIVTLELQKGYKLRDRVIRPAMVKVNMK